MRSFFLNSSESHGNFCIIIWHINLMVKPLSYLNYRQLFHTLKCFNIGFIKNVSNDSIKIERHSSIYVFQTINIFKMFEHKKH